MVANKLSTGLRLNLSSIEACPVRVSACRAGPIRRAKRSSQVAPGLGRAGGVPDVSQHPVRLGSDLPRFVVLALPDEHREKGERHMGGGVGASPAQKFVSRRDQRVLGLGELAE